MYINQHFQHPLSHVSPFNGSLHLLNKQPIPFNRQQATQYTQLIQQTIGVPYSQDLTHNWVPIPSYTTIGPKSLTR